MFSLFSNPKNLIKDIVKSVVLAELFFALITFLFFLPVDRIDLTLHVENWTPFVLPEVKDDKSLALTFDDTTASRASLLDVDVVNYGKKAIVEADWQLQIEALSADAIALLNEEDVSKAKSVDAVSRESTTQLNLSFNVVKPNERLPLRLLLINPSQNLAGNADDLTVGLSKEIPGLADPEILNGCLFRRYFPSAFRAMGMLTFIVLFGVLIWLQRTRSRPVTVKLCFLFIGVSVAVGLIAGLGGGSGVAYLATCWYGGCAAL